MQSSVCVLHFFYLIKDRDALWEMPFFPSPNWAGLSLGHTLLIRRQRAKSWTICPCWPALPLWPCHVSVGVTGIALALPRQCRHWHSLSEEQPGVKRPNTRWVSEKGLVSLLPCVCVCVCVCCISISESHFYFTYV